MEVDRARYADARTHRPLHADLGEHLADQLERGGEHLLGALPDVALPASGRPSTASRPSVTPTDMPVAPIGDADEPDVRRTRSTSVDRRPPRDAAGPASWASPSSASRATSAAIVVRETLEPVGELAFDSGPPSRSWTRSRACMGLSARPARE